MILHEMILSLWQIVSLPAVSAPADATSGDVRAHNMLSALKESWFHAGADVFIFSSVAACRTSFVFIADWWMETFIIVKLFIGD